MRVLHVMDHSLPRTDGYAIRAKYLLEAQAAFGHDVVVLTSPSQGSDATDEEILGVRYERSFYTSLEQKLVGVKGKQLVFGRALRRKLEELSASDAFDLVHAHTPFTVALPALRFARAHGLPLVYEKRNLWEESALARGKISGRWPLYQVSQRVDRYVTTRADAVCVITEALRQYAISMGVDPGRVVVVSNGVDVDAFTPRQPHSELRSRCLQGGAFVIGFIGSFYKFEGLPLLVEAFGGLSEAHPDARLVLVGDGEDRPVLEAYADTHGIACKCWLTGRVPHDQVLDYYAAMDVLVYPRYRSKLTDMISPLKPLEPMAMGIPVVVSDVGGLGELVEADRTGFVFSAGSSAALAEALGKLIRDPVRAATVGTDARRSVIETRQWRHIAERYDVAYQKAIE